MSNKENRQRDSIVDSGLLQKTISQKRLCLSHFLTTKSNGILQSEKLIVQHKR